MNISYGQAGTWARCPYKWSLSYVDKWTPKTLSPGLSMGGMIDELLNLLYSGKSYDEIMLAAREFTTRPKADINLISRVLKIIDRYIKDWHPIKDANWKVIEVQKYLEVGFTSPAGRPFTLEGYIDLLVWIESKIWLVETKSYGGSQWAWNETQLQMEPQTPIYIAACRELGIPVYGVISNQINTYDYKNPPETEKLFQRSKIHKTPAELDNVILQLGLVVDEIASHQGPYRKNLNRDCSWCAFQEPCLYDTKGIDPTHFLEMNFKKKEPRPEQTEIPVSINIAP